jgi:hypothetical protein
MSSGRRIVIQPLVLTAGLCGSAASAQHPVVLEPPLSSGALNVDARRV